MAPYLLIYGNYNFDLLPADDTRELLLGLRIVVGMKNLVHGCRIVENNNVVAAEIPVAPVPD